MGTITLKKCAREQVVVPINLMERDLMLALGIGVFPSEGGITAHHDEHGV